MAESISKSIPARNFNVEHKIEMYLRLEASERLHKIYAQLTPRAECEALVEDNCVLPKLNNKFAHQMPQGAGHQGLQTWTALSSESRAQKRRKLYPISGTDCGLLSPRALGTRGPAKVLNKVALEHVCPSVVSQSKYLNLVPGCSCSCKCDWNWNWNWNGPEMLNWIWVFVSA